MADSPTKIHLDLDSIEREQVRGVPKKKDPWVVTVDGQSISFTDPAEVDAAVLMVMEDTPARFFRATLDDDDFTHMMNVFHTPGKLPGYKLRAIMQGYRTYYGLDDAGNVVGSRG